MVDLDDLTFDAKVRVRGPRPTRRRRVGALIGPPAGDGARRAADLTDCCSMYSTAALLRDLADAAGSQVSAAARVMDSE